MSVTPNPSSTTLELAAPGIVRCTCGAFLCRACAPSDVEVKCRRCKQVMHIVVAGTSVG